MYARTRLGALSAAGLTTLLAAACSGGGGSTVPPAGVQTAAAQRSTAQPAAMQAAPVNALYVSDTYGKSVFRFVRQPDGTLQTPAGSSLVLPYHPGPIAIGPNGSLLVSDQENQSIEVYARRPSGYQQPSRTLLLPFAPSCVAVDANGYEYVGGYTNGYVAVYAPHAHGPAGTLQRIALPDGHPTINGVAVDRGGNLYVSDSNEISEFGTPTSNPTLLRAIVGTGQLNQPTGMAVAPGSGELYVANAGNGNVLAYSPAANGHDKPARTIRSQNPSLTAPLGVAVRGTSLYSTSGSKVYGTPSIFVLNPMRGKQTPKQVVTGSYLASPVGVALGP